MNASAHNHTGAGTGHGSLQSYLLGFGLSVVLTAIPFWLVMTHAIASSRLTVFVIMAFAAIQIVVHVFCFLHVNARSENGWTMMAFIFTIVMVLIVLAGSVWIMYNLNANMMPMTPQSAGSMP